MIHKIRNGSIKFLEINKKMPIKHFTTSLLGLIDLRHDETAHSEN